MSFAQHLWASIGDEIDAALKKFRPRRAYVGVDAGGLVTLSNATSQTPGKEKYPRLAGPDMVPGTEVLVLPLDDKRSIVLGAVQKGAGGSGGSGQAPGIFKQTTRTGTFSMGASYTTGQGTTLGSAATIVTTADGYNPAKPYLVTIGTEIFVTPGSGVECRLTAKRQDLSSLGIAGWSLTLPSMAAEQLLSANYVFHLPAGGLPGGNGVAANTLDVRIQIWASGLGATGRDGRSFAYLLPLS